MWAMNLADNHNGGGGMSVTQSLEQEVEIREQLKNMATKLSEIKADDYIRKEELGKDLCFEDTRPVFERVAILGKQLLSMDYTTLPHQSISIILNNLNSIKQSISNISNYKSAQGEGPRNQLSDALYSTYYSFISSSAAIIGFVARSNEDVLELRNQAHAVVDELKSEQSKALAEMEVARIEAEESLNAVKKSAGELGLTSHSLHFTEQASSDGKSAEWWLKATFASTFIVIGLGFLFATDWVWKISGDASLSQILRHMLPKVVLLSVGGYIVNFCARSYSAFRHMQAVNLHRRNALATFNAFAKAAQDERVEDAILLQASQSIFSPRPTGFLKNEMDGNETKSVFEIMGTAAAKSVPITK
jgi:hypothetical protein